ncbi:MAG: hypothetical protein WCJ35_21090 [Planctomycetota bacterium]
MNAQPPYKCVLKDVSDCHSGKQPVTVSVENHNLALIVHPEGYGVYDDDSAPILLERHEGKLRLIVWADINDQEPTHIIGLEGAKVDMRQETSA